MNNIQVKHKMLYRLVGILCVLLVGITAFTQYLVQTPQIVKLIISLSFFVNGLFVIYLLFLTWKYRQIMTLRIWLNIILLFFINFATAYLTLMS